MSYFNIHY